ncbi:hypothetical protein CWI75_16290 [Kineobactrum sediminis]|uniref:Uncharacterized protein n=1 Tax=Kineobactrum sediminis TaxID=1905677 RepID=A0A2N5XZ63_9GAMM|nr:hypothetical protein [Kineobactrum sediminis]PLW81389.1 hypothetical protein CWI75_16290 [Kineobactrum sediminis]
MKDTVNRLHHQFQQGTLGTDEVKRLARWALTHAEARHYQPESLFKYTRIRYLASRPSSGTETVLDLWCEVLEVSKWYYRSVESAPAQWLASLEHALVETHPACVSYDSYDYFLAHGWTVHDMVLSSIELSTANIGNYDGSFEDIEHWVRLREKNLPFFLGVTCCGTLVGQWALTLLTGSEYQALLCGTLEEDEIAGARYTGPGEYIGYISTTTLHRDFRRHRFLRGLLEHIAGLMRSQLTQGVRFLHIGANAYTEAGVQLCRLFGLEYVTEHCSQGQVYVGDERQILDSPLLRRNTTLPTGSGRDSLAL